MIMHKDIRSCTIAMGWLGLRRALFMLTICSLDHRAWKVVGSLSKVAIHCKCPTCQLKLVCLACMPMPALGFM